MPLRKAGFFYTVIEDDFIKCDTEGETNTLSVLALVTNPAWLDVLKDNRYDGEVNFWRPGQTSIAEKHYGSTVVFIRKGREPRNVVGFGILHRTEELSIQKAWEKWGTKNGVTSLKEFQHRLKEIAKRTSSNTGGILADSFKTETLLQCAIITQMTLLPPSQWRNTLEAFDNIGGFHRNIVSYKVFANASLTDIFPDL